MACAKIFNPLLVIGTFIIFNICNAALAEGHNDSKLGEACSKRVNCEWKKWSDWSRCQNGTTWRTRDFTAASCGGAVCTGNDAEEMNCSRIDESADIHIMKYAAAPAGGGGESYPYYFGTTDLACLTIRGKREAPHRNTTALSHRWIYYRGYYFEFANIGWSVATKPWGADKKCSRTQEQKPAGWSSQSVSCLRKCAAGYSNWFGKYNLFTNNCHHFANKMSDVFYWWPTGCPAWCK